MVPQAYVHKTNWTMQQAKDELEAARQQDSQQSTEASSADSAVASNLAGLDEGQCPAFRTSADTQGKQDIQQSPPEASSTDSVVSGKLTGIDERQCPAFQSSADIQGQPGTSTPAQALRGSYGGRDLPLPGSSTQGSMPDQQQGSVGLEADEARQSAGGDVQQAQDTSSAAGEARETEGGCPYIGFTMSSNFLDAQCLWDATMAYSIAQSLGSAPSPPKQEYLTNVSSSSLRPAYSNDVEQSGAAKQEELIPTNKSRQSSAHGNDMDLIGGGERSSSGSETASQASPLVIHICGKFHSEGWMGIYEHIHGYHAGAFDFYTSFRLLLRNVDQRLLLRLSLWSADTPITKFIPPMLWCLLAESMLCRLLCRAAGAPNCT